MTEQRGSFEQRLAERLRALTEPATRRADWVQEAREVIATGGGPSGARRSPWRLASVSAAVVVLAAAAALSLVDLVPDLGGSSQTPTVASLEPSASVGSETPLTPAPSTIAGADLPLGELAWWNTQDIAFGYVEPPPSDAPPLPEAYRLLTIGTLDGTIAAQLHLNPNQSHSSVSGPVGTDVVVANDEGAQTSVFTISATDGSRTDLFASGDLVPAAILSADGTTLFYVMADRVTGADTGLWSRPRAGGAATQLVLGPLGEPIRRSFDDITYWWLTLSPDGGTMVVQWCRGGVTCRTHLIDLATREGREVTGAGWPIGITDELFVADGVSEHDDEIVGVDLLGGETRTLVASPDPAQVIQLGSGWWLAFGADPALIDVENVHEPIHSLPGNGTFREGTIFLSSEGRYGVDLPDGWFVRWLDQSPATGQSSSPGQLINIATGERVDLAAMQLPTP
jgi:hypothetical protein